jgi:hypothetical protein
MFVVVEGIVTISSKATGEGTEGDFHQLRRGECFGEIAMVLNEPAAATLVAESEHVVAFVLHRFQYDQLVRLSLAHTFERASQARSQPLLRCASDPTGTRPTHRLAITVISGSDLRTPDNHSWTSVQPFVQLQLQSSLEDSSASVTQATGIGKNNAGGVSTYASDLNVTWNQPFHFKVGMFNTQLVLEVLNHDRTGSHTSMGRVTIPVDFVQAFSEDETRELVMPLSFGKTMLSSRATLLPCDIDLNCLRLGCRRRDRR